MASVDTRTAATTLFALPRNIEHAPFPPGSPAAARFPRGFHDRRAPDSGDYLLNNVVGYGRAHLALAPAGPTADRGVNLLMSSVSTMLGLPIAHYVAVDMDGLAALIDALGGVTVDVGPEPLPIGGVTYSGRHVTPDGYVPAGVQHLDGEQALWFARSRRDSDDYDRMARQRCLIGAVLAQKRPSDVVARFRAVAPPPRRRSPRTSRSPCCRRCWTWPTSTGRRGCAASRSTRICPTPRPTAGGSIRPTRTSRSCGGSSVPRWPRRPPVRAGTAAGRRLARHRRSTAGRAPSATASAAPAPAPSPWPRAARHRS